MDTGDTEAQDCGARPIRVLIVDDHEVVRQGLRVFLADDPTIAIVGEAEDGIAALERARQVHPDVVLMNLVMPRMDGIAATTALRAELPTTEVLILTSALDEERLVAAVRAGAIGYLLKDTTAEELRRAIIAAAAGQVQLSPVALAGLMRGVRAPELTEPLTERETAVLRLLSRGLANKEIAGRLGIGEQTVKTHVHNLLTKLGVASRTQAALYGARAGLVELRAGFLGPRPRVGRGSMGCYPAAARHVPGVGLPLSMEAAAPPDVEKPLSPITDTADGSAGYTISSDNGV